MIFVLWPLPKAPGAGDPKHCAVACAIHVSNLQTNSGWISEKKIEPKPHSTPKSHPWGLTKMV